MQNLYNDILYVCTWQVYIDILISNTRYFDTPRIHENYQYIDIASINQTPCILVKSAMEL